MARTSSENSEPTPDPQGGSAELRLAKFFEKVLERMPPEEVEERIRRALAVPVSDPHPDQRIEEAAREIVGAFGPVTRPADLVPILQGLWDAGKKAGAEEEQMKSSAPKRR